MSNVEIKAEPAAAARSFLRFAKRDSPWDTETPIREELFSVERLQTHARSLALAQPVASPTTRGLPLAPRLAKNGEALLSAYQSIVKAIDEGRALTPAAEWLIDNYHLVEKQIRQIQMDLPPGYYRQLPKLVTGPFAGYPRVFGIAWAFVAHTDSCFEAEILVSYINAYQEIQPLTIGELWAVSITLQIVLIENLRRLAQRITQSRIARHEADAVADRLLGVGGQAGEPASKVFAGRGAGPGACRGHFPYTRDRAASRAARATKSRQRPSHVPRDQVTSRTTKSRPNSPKSHWSRATGLVTSPLSKSHWSRATGLVTCARWGEGLARAGRPGPVPGRVGRVAGRSGRGAPKRGGAPAGSRVAEEEGRGRAVRPRAVVGTAMPGPSARHVSIAVMIAAMSGFLCRRTEDISLKFYVKYLLGREYIHLYCNREINLKSRS